MPDLVQISRQTEAGPFELLLDNGTRLGVQEVVRRVPGQRLVGRGEWQGQVVFAKIFIGPRAAYHVFRDAAGVERLQQAGIRTPALLCASRAQTSSGLVQLLIFTAIRDAANAEQAYLAAPAAERLQLAQRLVTELARHHHAGLLQTDLYLKNFLVAGTVIYTLDGDGIRALPKFFSYRAATTNLARLLSKFDVLEVQHWLPSLLEHYATARRWQAPTALRSMQIRIRRLRQLAVRRYAESKVFRECTDIAVLRSWSYFLARTRRWTDATLTQELLAAPDALVGGQQRLKSGNTCTVSLAEISGRSIVVKRYNIKSFQHACQRCWRPSRAAVSWANAQRLLMYGIATARPLALLEKRWGPLRGRAYFLAEYIEAPTVAELMRNQRISPERKRSVMRMLATLMYKLSLLQIVHGDLKASNILVAADRIALIDLDSMREYGCRIGFARGHVRDLRRLLRNWDEQLEVRQWLVEALQKIYGDHVLLVRALHMSPITEVSESFKA